MFKRPIVPSDFEHPKFSESLYDCENEKGTKSGKEMFKPKYGTLQKIAIFVSHYRPGVCETLVRSGTDKNRKFSIETFVH